MGWMSTCTIRAITSGSDSSMMCKRDTQRKPPRFLLAVLEIIVGIFEPNKLTPYRSARETVDLAKQIIGYVYGADERNRPTNESPSNDAEFLEWLYVRLVGTHGENPNTDFMQNLNSIIEKLR